MPWKTLALVAAFAIVNAFRRNANSRLLWEEPGEWLEDIAQTTLTGFVIAAIVVVAVTLTFDRIPSRGWRRALAMIGVIAFSTAIGTLILAAVEVWIEASDLSLGATFAGNWPRYAVLGLLFAWAYAYYRDRQEAREAMRQSEVDRAELERRIVESQLMVLQAQIEPHFLFNTLAHVKTLYQTDNPKGRTMLGNLRTYLEGALPQMREPIARLDREVSLVQAYLGMQQTRMGSRLSYAIEVPDDLAAVRIPTMMILTLVENAIKHGLSPLREGGSVRISATEADGRLRIGVADSGRGFVATSGGGAGLANLRARLAILYGPRATLDLAHNELRGVTAVLTFPLDSAALAATER